MGQASTHPPVRGWHPWCPAITAALLTRQRCLPQPIQQAQQQWERLLDLRVKQLDEGLCALQERVVLQPSLRGIPASSTRFERQGSGQSAACPINFAG